MTPSGWNYGELLATRSKYNTNTSRLLENIQLSLWNVFCNTVDM